MYPEPIERYRRTLEIAIKREAITMVLETLVRIAEFLRETGEKEKAVEIAALVLCYPMRAALRERAERLFLQLENELQADVVQAARMKTDVVTLDDMVEMILAV